MSHVCCKVRSELLYFLVFELSLTGGLTRTSAETEFSREVLTALLENKVGRK